MRVVTFGECLFRLVTHQGERLSTADSLGFHLGGTELNIAANLQSLGLQTSWVSLVTDGSTGAMIRDRIERLHVDLTHIQTIAGGRPGWYLMETGSSPRPDKVFHRSASSIAEEKNFSFDWKSILTNCSLFHTSGVTTGLSVELTNEVKKAMSVARDNKILVSYDFNYRKNIWSIEEFVRRQKDLIPLIDILFCSDSDLELFFNTTDYKKILSTTNLETLVINRRNPNEMEYGIDVINKKGQFISKRYPIESIDRIGVGDSMAAGYLKARLSGLQDQATADWASLCGALKYGIKGDMALLKADEIESILNSTRKGIDR